MPAACRCTCASVLLALVAAEWVEISQHRYRNPFGPARFDSHPLQEQAPTKYTTDLLDPVQHPFLKHNAQNPTKTYQDVDSRNTYLYHDVPLEDPISEDSFERDLRPALDRVPDRLTDPLNPFKDNSEMRNTYVYEHVSKNKYFLPDNKKPMRTDFSSVDDLFLVPTSETYANHTENNWYQNIRQQNNVRSDIELIAKEPTYTKQQVERDRTKNNHLLHIDRNDGTDERSKYAEVDIDQETTKIKNEDHGSNSGKVERVSNLGSVKRVNLANTPVKSPTLKLNKISENPKRRNDVRPANVDDFSDELNLETDGFKNTRVEKVALLSTKNLEIVFNDSEKVGQIDIPIVQGDTLEKDKAIIETTETVLNNTNGHKFIAKPEIVTVTTEAIDNWRHHDASSVGEVRLKEKQAGANNRPIKPTGNDPFVDKTERLQDKEEKNKTNGFKSKLNANSDSIEYENSHDEEGNIASLENNEKTSGEIKVNTMEKILKFIKAVAETISKNTKRGGDAKITYLNELKHSLLTNIKERIEAAWPEDGPRRLSRSARGHVEFPSSESALMTISFLTFAVFLIKLVLIPGDDRGSWPMFNSVASHNQAINKPCRRKKTIHQALNHLRERTHAIRDGLSELHTDR